VEVISRQRFVSVIVICYNESKHLELCLGALKNQDYDSDAFEIIFIDNGSTDSSVEIAKKYANKVEIHPRLKLGGLRNLGASLAKGEILAFIDADCEAKPQWLASINNIYVHSLESVSGSRCLIDTTSSWVSRAFCPAREIGRFPSVSLSTQNLIVPAMFFKQVGGFDESLSTGEDAELCLRLAHVTPVMYDSRLEYIHHGEPADLKTFFRREVWHGLGAFGSFKVKKFDKPLIATLIYLMGFLFLSIGLIRGILGMGFGLCSLGFLLIAMVVSFSVIYRVTPRVSYLQFAQLICLYFVYFFARSISLLILLLGAKHFYYKSRRV